MIKCVGLDMLIVLGELYSHTFCTDAASAWQYPPGNTSHVLLTIMLSAKNLPWYKVSQFLRLSLTTNV